MADSSSLVSCRFAAVNREVNVLEEGQEGSNRCKDD